MRYVVGCEDGNLELADKISSSPAGGGCRGKAVYFFKKSGARATHYRFLVNKRGKVEEYLSFYSNKRVFARVLPKKYEAAVDDLELRVAALKAQILALLEEQQKVLLAAALDGKLASAPSETPTKEGRTR